MMEELIRLFWEESLVIRQRETKNGNKNTEVAVCSANTTTVHKASLIKLGSINKPFNQ